MDSDLFCKKKIKNYRKRIISKIGNQVRKTLQMEPVRIQPLNFGMNVKCSNVLF